MESLGIKVSRFGRLPPIMENQMGQKMDHEMDAEIILGSKYR